MLSQGLSECHIISTGTLQRWNIIAESEEVVDEKTAHDQAQLKEDAWIFTCKEVLLTLGAEVNPENENKITVRLSERETEFIIHRWDDLLGHPRYGVYKEQYEAALNDESTKVSFEQARDQTIENFLRRSSRKFASEEAKTKYRNNSREFLDEEAPMMPLLYIDLKCQYVFYPGTCLSLFQRVYQHLLPSEASSDTSKRHKEIWREIKFGNKFFTNAVKSQVTDYFCNRGALYNSDTIKKNLDTALYLLPKEYVEEIEKYLVKNRAEEDNSNSSIRVDRTIGHGMRFFARDTDIESKLKEVEMLVSNPNILRSLSTTERMKMAERLTMAGANLLSINDEIISSNDDGVSHTAAPSGSPD